MSDGIGLSVGATNLTAVVVGRTALTRSAVLTRYPHRAPEVGVPSENPNLTERGLIFTDFVDRVGDPVPIVAADGSTHRAEVLLAEALRALLAAVGDSGPVGVSHPAHWRGAAVEALRSALAAIPELSSAPVVSDAVAALTAVQHDPGLPTHGVIALCDFGGTGTSVTFADAAAGNRPVAPTVRHTDLSGNLIDQGLLTRVVADLTAAGTLDVSGTSALGSLTRLRAQCRAAKERLSTTSATTLTADVGGQHGELRLTRDELDELIREPLDEFLSTVRDTMDRNGIRPADVSAVATVGGGARIPLITTALSERLRVPVVTTPQPALTAAIGSGLTAARAALAGPGVDATQRAPLDPVVAPLVAGPDQTSTQLWEEEPAAEPALAWSEADDLPEVYAPPAAPVGPADVRPDLQFDEPQPGGAVPPPDQADAVPWYRQPQVLFAAAVVAVLLALTAAVLTLRGDDTPVPAVTTEPTTTEAPTETPPAPPPPPETEAPPPPPPRTVYQTQPPAPVEPAPPPPAEEPPPPPPEPTEEPPPEPTEEPPPATEEPPPATEEPPPATEEPPPTTTRPRWLPTLPRPTLPTIPGLPPRVPGDAP